MSSKITSWTELEDLTTEGGRLDVKLIANDGTLKQHKRYTRISGEGSVELDRNDTPNVPDWVGPVPDNPGSNPDFTVTRRDKLPHTKSMSEQKGGNG